ncbi:hypothetical protein D8O27_25125 [Burkholderia mallei]|uniref:Uncharacterized protein n=2 Tax=Burkholderia mallei TaxID=13373 RepID=A0AAQ0QP71_BURML|nr:hypothetical protein BMAA0713 [Burkholderia mallei ATCC 23344]RKN93362.1 hypothetical protein D8O31_24960 [Burkholderia mallei]RKN96868.1 hypothetical protein D8O03_21090 [Burkholderia mallei]RKN98099.1 hypothetical protein D8O05_23965 [Burkholderia mallei]RKO09413.1 hypothetical protein D8O04_25765 [Burkholderia mallei]
MSASCSRFSRALPALYPHLAHALRGFADDRRCMTRSERPSAATATPKAGSSARIERARACG